MRKNRKKVADTIDADDIPSEGEEILNISYVRASSLGMIKEYSGGEIIIVNKKDDMVDPEEKLAYDVLQIMNVFVTKMNGLRKYKNQGEKEPTW